MDPWVEVWQPELAVVKHFGKALLEILSTRCRRVWCYEAPGDVRVLKPLGFYRMQPWVALRCGLQGSGYWVYQYHDLWGVAKHEPDYGTVNVDRTSVVNSRRWRASHDGVQDVTAVIVLDQAIGEAEKAGVDRALVAKAKAARAAAVAEVTAGQENLGPISIMFSDYAVEFDLLQRHRRAVADATIALRAALAAPRPRSGRPRGGMGGRS
jgi:hypothetical protein